MRQTWLAKKGGPQSPQNTQKTRKITLKLIPDKHAKRVDVEIVEGSRIDFDPEEGTIARAHVKCPVCGGTIDDDTTRKLFREGQSGQRMMAVVLHHPNRTGKTYRLPTDRDLAAYRAAETALEKKSAQLREAWGIEPVPDEPLPIGGRDRFDTCRLPLYGLTRWGDLLNTRQKLALITFADKVRQAHARMLAAGADPEFAKAVATYLAIIFNRLADKNANLVVYNCWGKDRARVWSSSLADGMGLR